MHEHNTGKRRVPQAGVVAPHADISTAGQSYLL